MIWKWIGVMLLCTSLGIVYAYGLASLLTTYAHDFVIGWAPRQAGPVSFSSFDVAAGNCVIFGAPFGLLAGISIMIVDSRVQCLRIAASK